jgi:hypothetical protein
MKVPRERRACLTGLAILVVSLAIVPTGAGGVGSSGERTVTDDYMTPAPAIMPVHPYGAAVCNRGGALGGNRGCVDFTPISITERWLSVEISDASTLPVPAFLQWADADIDEWIPFCGRTTKPLKVKGSVTVWIFAYRAANLPLCPGTATTGEVRATFSSHR